MIDKDGNAKIMDFGIARSLHTRGATGTGVIIGTPEYMAPEQAEGRDIDHRVDIYALGAIMFEMVTGRVPFEGQTPLSIVLKHRSEPPADPQTINAQISEGLSRIILRCLAKKRDDRYDSAADVLEDLAAVEHGLPMTRLMTARMKPATARTKPVAEREITVKFKLRKLFVPALLVAVVVAAVYTWRTARSAVEKVAEQGRRSTIAVPDVTSGRSHDSIVKRVGTPPAPPPPSGEVLAAGGADVETGHGASAGILGYLTPFMKDPAKFMNEKDALEFDKALAEIKQKYPKESAALGQWLDSIQLKISEGKKQKAAGNLEASKRSYDRGESEMRKLLSQVSERERAEAAFQELAETKRKMAGAAGGRPNLLAWIALEKERDASDAFAKNDFSGARILCGILTRVHQLSPKATDETKGLAALEDLTAGIRKDAEAAGAPAKQAWLFERAVTEQASAGQMAEDGLIPQAAEQYILAAFLYEKAKEVSLESAQAGRN
jgi:hypothetical protein